MLDSRAYAQIALEVAEQAGSFLLKSWRSRPSVTEKRPTELVTEYDLASERLIVRELRQRTPDIAIVGEEGGGKASADLTWYCDPIDGTTNFAHGHHFWCVSIGLLQAGVPIAGAVVAPALATTWLAFQGGAPLRNHAPCRVSQTARVSDALIATGFPSDRSQAPANNFDSFMRVKRACRAVRRCGAAAIDLCLVADGTYDAYWERKLLPWDSAAGAAAVLAAGGTISALNGGPYDLEHGHILASNGLIHTELLALI